MSTDCESVVSPPIGSESLSHPLSLPSTSIRSERHSHAGISYEGRVSLIPPMNRYEASMRAAYGFDSPSSSLLHSPPLQSNQGHNRQDPLYSAYLENNLRSTLSLQPQSHVTPASRKDYDSYKHYLERLLKQESNRDYQDIEVSQPRNNLKDVNVEINDLSNSLKDGNENEHSINVQINFDKSAQNLQILAKSNPKSRSLINPSENCEDLPIEEITDCDFPFITQENERRSSSPVPDQHDQRDIDTDPSSIINNYLDTTHEIIQHGENAKSLKCQFCSYSTDSKQEFSNHVSIHFDHKCMKCEFTTQTVEQLKDHLKEEHDLSPEDVVDFEGARVPRINAQGKVKTFKCKQCGYIAITKSDFWEHAKTHIKSEKLLACSKCPFVTEYKHHLEYHMRNHFGTKPFKCNKCSYSCVNKSMLNSHMKSHSNVYQYRCNECSYATKYCHSLKLHLRKYNHTPAMVLNPDGSPNPVPIIDIYGTRRGPKLKKDENGMPILPPQYQLQAHFVRAHMEATGTLPPAPTAPLDKYPNKGSGTVMNLNIPPPPFANAFSFAGNIQSYPSFIPHEFMESESAHKHEIQDDEHESKDKVEKLNISKSPEVQETFKCDICNFTTQAKEVLSHHMLLHAKDKEELESRDISSTAAEKVKAVKDNFPVISPVPSHKLVNESIKHVQQGFAPHLTNPKNPFQDYIRAINPLLYPPLMSGQGFVHPALELQQQLQRLVYQSATESNMPINEQSFGISPVKPQGQAETVLDLSKEHTPPGSVSSQQNSSSISPSLLPASPPNSDVSTPPSKNRRKGRAYKFERISLRLSGEEENSCGESSDAHKEHEGSRLPGTNIPHLLPLSLSESSNERSNAITNGKWKEDNQCNYCDIAFKDEVLYTMHMGYHGYKNPFTCNMCGFDAKDKVAFFLHIARASHR